MKASFGKGLSFGLASAVITTLGLMTGVYASTQSKLAVISGIIVIAISDALSDSLGMHLSVESENRFSVKEIWESTVATFFSKLIFALTFLIPFLFLQMFWAIIVSVVWGLLLLTIYSIYLANKEKVPAYKVVFEHLVIAIIVILIAHLVGYGVAMLF